MKRKYLPTLLLALGWCLLGAPPGRANIWIDEGFEDADAFGPQGIGDNAFTDGVDIAHDTSWMPFNPAYPLSSQLTHTGEITDEFGFAGTHSYRIEAGESVAVANPFSATDSGSLHYLQFAVHVNGIPAAGTMATLAWNFTIEDVSNQAFVDFVSNGVDAVDIVAGERLRGLGSQVVGALDGGATNWEFITIQVNMNSSQGDDREETGGQVGIEQGPTFYVSDKTPAFSLAGSPNYPGTGLAQRFSAAWSLSVSDSALYIDEVYWEAGFDDGNDGLRTSEYEALRPLDFGGLPLAPPRLVDVSPDERFPMSAGAQAVGLRFSVDMDPAFNPTVVADREPLASDTVPLAASFTLSASPGWTDSRLWRGSTAIAAGTPDGPYGLRVAGSRTLDGREVPEDTRHRVRVTKGIEEAAGVVGATMANALLIDWELPSNMKRIVPGVAGSKVFRATLRSGPYDLIARVPVPVSEYLDVGLDANTDYYYRVVVLGEELEEVSRTQPIRGETKAANAYSVVISASEIEIHWTPGSATDLVSTQILRGVPPSPPDQPIASLPPTGDPSASFLDRDLEPSTLYHYQIEESVLVDGSVVVSELERAILARTGDRPSDSEGVPRFAVDSNGFLSLFRSVRARESLPVDLFEYSLFWGP